MAISVCLAGATGWAGSELARSIAAAADLTLVAAVSRTHAGRRLEEVLKEPRLTCPIYATAAEGLADGCDVFVEYTKPDVAKANILAALARGAHVVVGTSGLTDGDYGEIDGTARELASRLSKVRRPEPTVPVDATVGQREARGATVSASQVHSVRLPGYVISAEIIFGMPDQRLTIRHDSGSNARPYVDGALLAIRKVSTLVGLHRGLGAVLDL